VSHDGGVDIIETTLVNKVDFAPFAFFSGGAQYQDRAGQFFLLQTVSQGFPGPQGNGTDQVVTTGMADFRQGIIF